MWAYTNSIKSTSNSSGVGRGVKDNITPKQVTYKLKHILIFLEWILPFTAVKNWGKFYSIF